MAETLANPTVEVNDEVIAILPNSVTYKKGRGDNKVRTQSTGGATVDTVITTDAETMKGMVKFTMITTKENVDRLDAWYLKTAGSTVRLSEGSFNVSFRRMVVISDPEISAGAEGTFDVEFEGQSVI